MVKLRRNKKYSSRRPKISYIKGTKKFETNTMNNEHTSFRFFYPKTVGIIYLDQNEESYFVPITLSIYITASTFVLFFKIPHHSISYQHTAHNHAVRNCYRFFCLMAFGKSFALSATPLAKTVIINECRQEKSIRNMFYV